MGEKRLVYLDSELSQAGHNRKASPVSPRITLDNVFVRFPIIGAEARSLKKAALAGVASLAGKAKVGGRLSTATDMTGRGSAERDLPRYCNGRPHRPHRPQWRG